MEARAGGADGLLRENACGPACHDSLALLRELRYRAAARRERQRVNGRLSISRMLQAGADPKPERLGNRHPMLPPQH